MPLGERAHRGWGYGVPPAVLPRSRRLRVRRLRFSAGSPLRARATAAVSILCAMSPSEVERCAWSVGLDPVDAYAWEGREAWSVVLSEHKLWLFFGDDRETF